MQADRYQWLRQGAIEPVFYNAHLFHSGELLSRFDERQDAGATTYAGTLFSGTMKAYEPGRTISSYRTIHCTYITITPLIDASSRVEWRSDHLCNPKEEGWVKRPSALHGAAA